MARILGFLAALVISIPSVAATLEGVSNTEAASGLKQALADGSAAAVAQLGRENGFLSNPKVKIPLPPALQRVESALRFAGMKRQADDLVVAMNRAAEAAVPEAKALLVDSVKRMSVQDAKGILTGGDTAATDYFKRTTEGQLTKRFLPIVKQATDQVGLAEQYNSLAGQGVQLGLIRQDQSTIEGYVTRKALDGLYLMIAEQEKAFRQNPLGASSDIVKRVFGALHSAGASGR
jgi:hypothetical protein